MKTIIELQGPSNVGKTTSIVLAARKQISSGARLIAKYNGVIVEIIEVYAVNTPHGLVYVAYISQGDDVKSILKNLDILDSFVKVATTKSLSLVTEMMKFGLCTKKDKKEYQEMQITLQSIGTNFQIDYIVIACHQGNTQKAIHTYALKHSYEEMIISPFIVSNKAMINHDYINNIATANDACAVYINNLINIL